MGLETHTCFQNSSLLYPSPVWAALLQLCLSLSLFLLISENQPPKPQPCDLCVCDVFPFRFARASSSPAKYVTLRRGFAFRCSIETAWLHLLLSDKWKGCIAPAADLSKHATYRLVFSAYSGTAGEVCSFSALWPIVPIMKTAQLQCMMAVAPNMLYPEADLIEECELRYWSQR